MIQATNHILNEEMNAVMNPEIMNNKERGQVKRRIGWLRGKIAEYGNELSELLSSMPEVEEKVRGKGRPTKAKKAPEEVEDLFAQLVISNIKSVEVVEVVEVVDLKADLDADLVEETPKKSNKPKKHVLTEEEKEAKKAALEEEKLAKKAALEEEKLAKKALEKEQKAFLELEKKVLKKLEDDKKKQALEEEKASKKAVNKVTKKPVESVQDQEEKASKKAPKKASKKQVEAVVVAVEVPVPEEKATKVTVTRITIGDMKYLKSNTNVLYNETTREEVGLYDAETNTIKPLPEDDDAEMTEDDYESSSDRE